MFMGKSQEVFGENEGPNWDLKTAVQNQLAMMLPVFLGATALVRKRSKKLLPYLLLVGFFHTLWRRVVCARCQYYGKTCSTLLGIFTSRIMPRDEKKKLDRNTMLIDFTMVGLIAFLPLKEALSTKKVRVLYPVSLLLGISAIFFRGCPECGNDFCPLKQLYESVVRG